jgi:hypothetical protein
MGLMVLRDRNIIRAKRNAIARRTAIALSNLKKGAIKKGSVKDLYKDLENG